MSKEGLNRISSINSELNEFTEDDGKKIYNVNLHHFPAQMFYINVNM
jgi:hypothetical protein